jgi:hypothetical protein
MILTGENRSTRGKPVPVPLCPPQIPHALAWDRALASVVRGRRLFTRATIWPSKQLPYVFNTFVLVVEFIQRTKARKA